MDKLQFWVGMTLTRETPFQTIFPEIMWFYINSSYTWRIALLQSKVTARRSKPRTYGAQLGRNWHFISLYRISFVPYVLYQLEKAQMVVVNNFDLRVPPVVQLTHHGLMDKPNLPFLVLLFRRHVIWYQLIRIGSQVFIQRDSWDSLALPIMDFWMENSYPKL